MPVLKPVYNVHPMLGCDPEFFLRINGEVVGSELIIPKTGLGSSGCGKVIIDGVQAELNPSPATCRAHLTNYIASCFHDLKTQLKVKGGKIECDFGTTVEISKERLAELDEKSRVFGCAPSSSIYKTKVGIKLDTVDPSEYRIRAAGGHLHFGTSGMQQQVARALKDDHVRTVEMLDLICGNTAVLIDRDPGNIERRKVYGRAGEFRQPKHGLEYRTLSNFWLGSAQLASFALGMGRLAVQLMADTKNHEEYYKEFMGATKAHKVHDAINNNDFDLAMENFTAIEPLLKDVTNEHGDHPISRETMNEFKYFVGVVKEKGLKHYFKQDPLTHWTSIGDGHSYGFNDYLRNTIRPQLQAELRKRKTSDPTKPVVHTYAN